MSDWLGPTEIEALRLSIRVAFWAVILSLPLAVAVAHLLARGRFWGHNLLNGLVHLPLVMPPVVTGYLLLLAFGRTGWIGQPLEAWFGITIAFRWTGAVMAAAVMAFPLMVRAIRLSIEALDPKLHDAAQSLGAPRWRIWLGITAPLIAPGVMAGAVLGFAKAMGEFGATITFVSNIPGQTQTMPLAIYSALQMPGGEAQAARLAGLSMVVALGALIASEWLARRMARRVGGNPVAGARR